MLALTACGDGAATPDAAPPDAAPDAGIDPTQVKFGDTALVVVLNPHVNDGNQANLTAPGVVREGVLITSDDGVADPTGADGIAVLAPLTPGLRTFTLSGALTGTFTVMMADGELREVAVSATDASATKMVELDYKTDQVVEISPTMTNAEVNAAIGVSDRVVFLKGGIYVGDLDFKGSRVTLFGEGVLGGNVTIQGNVAISGSDSRIRGALITGDLDIPGSGTGLTFSRVDGALTAMSSDTTLLVNALCGADTITGSGSIALGNTGVAPMPTCP